MLKFSNTSVWLSLDVHAEIWFQPGDSRYWYVLCCVFPLMKITCLFLFVHTGVRLWFDSINLVLHVWATTVKLANGIGSFRPPLICIYQFQQIQILTGSNAQDFSAPLLPRWFLQLEVCLTRCNFNEKLTRDSLFVRILSINTDICMWNTSPEHAVMQGLISFLLSLLGSCNSDWWSDTATY